MSNDGFDLQMLERIIIEVRERVEARSALRCRTTDDEWQAAELAVRKFERAVRQVRAAERGLPALVAEAGCSTEMADVVKAVRRLTIEWRDFKGAWRRSARPSA